MAESDFSSDQLSSSNWEVYQDVFAPQLTRQKARAWERAPVSAQAPRLQGHKIWKRAGTRSQTRKSGGDEDAHQELEREGAGARKKLRIMGAKENIGNAPWMEAQEDSENISSREQLLKDLADLSSHDFESDALQFVPRKRTNVNHVITPRKPLRQTTLNIQAQRFSPNKSLESLSEKSARKRKSTRKSTRILTRSDLEDATQSTVGDHHENQEPVSTSPAPGKSGPDVGPKLLEIEDQLEKANGPEEIPGTTELPESSIALEESVTANTSDQIDEFGDLRAEETPTPESSIAMGEAPQFEILGKEVEDYESTEDQHTSVNTEDSISQSLDEEQSKVATNTTEKINQSLDSPTGLVGDTPSTSIDATASSITELSETRPSSPHKPKMVVFGKVTTPKRRRTLNDIIAAENGSKVAVKTPRSAKKFAKTSGAKDNIPPSSSRNILRRSMRTTRSSAVYSEQRVTNMEQPQVAEDVLTESVQATTLPTENTPEEIRSAWNTEKDKAKDIASIDPDSVNGETQFEVTTDTKPKAEISVKPEEVVIESKQVLSNNDDDDENSNDSPVQSEPVEQYLGEETQVLDLKIDIPSERIPDLSDQDLSVTDTRQTMDEELAEDPTSSPEQVHLDTEPDQMDSPLSDISETSLLEFSPEITRTLHFDFSPATQENQAENEPSVTLDPGNTGVEPDLSEEDEEVEEITSTVSPIPDTLESTEAMTTITSSDTSHEDTEMLLKFLTRVQAKKAAKAEESPNKRRSLPHSPLRLPLGDTETNLSSPPNDQTEEIELAIKSSSPVKKRKRGGIAMEDQSGPESKIRRSGRTRLPVKTPPPGAPSFIPMRRVGEGDGTVTLKRSEERDLATLTRVNTRKNKGSSLSVSTVISKKAKEKDDPALRQRSLKEVFDEKAKRGKPKAKTVVWAEELVQYQETSARKAEKDKDVVEEKKSAVRVSMRSKIALGMAANGTPAPKRKPQGRL